MRLCLVDLDKWMMVNEKRSKIQVKLKFNKQMFHMIFFLSLPLHLRRIAKQE